MSTVIGLLGTPTEIQFHLISDSNERRVNLISIGRENRDSSSFVVSFLLSRQPERQRSSGRTRDGEKKDEKKKEEEVVL